MMYSMLIVLLGVFIQLQFAIGQSVSQPTPISICPDRIIMADAVGVIVSPGYPSNYGNSLTCKLTLKVPLIKQIEISYNHMDIEYSSGCIKDSLSFVESGGVTRTCGGGNALQASKKNKHDGDLTLIFRTDTNGTGKGFSIKYQLIERNVENCVQANGKQYLKRPYSMADFIKRPNDDINLSFKTKEPDGLFLYVKAGPNSYIMLKLDNGKVVFEVDFGKGNVSAAAPSGRLDDQKWHDVVVKRRMKNVNIVVDNLFRTSIVIPMNMTQLRQKAPSAAAGSTALYMFGGPSDIRYAINFTGWAKDLQVNDMKPIPSYVLKDPDYSLHGYGKLSKYYC